MTELDLRICGDVQVLRLQRGDIVVIKVPEPITGEMAEHIRTFMKQRVPTHDVIVLGGGMDILTLSAEKFAAQQEVSIVSTRLCDQMRELIDLARQNLTEIRRLQC